jgi:cytochrome P450
MPDTVQSGAGPELDGGQDEGVETNHEHEALSLMSPEVQNCPWTFYQHLHSRCPVYRMPETGFFVVTRWDDCRTVLADTETFSSDANISKGLSAERSRQRQQMLSDRGWGHQSVLHRADPPEHTRYRKMVNRVFSPRRVRDLVPDIEQVTNDLIDAFVDRGECEFFSEFAQPLPGTVIAEQLGLDRSEIVKFKRWGDAMLAPASRVLSEEELIRCVELELEAQHHFARVFEARRAEPRDDIMSALVHVHEEIDGEVELTMNELQDFMYQFITGGFETITSGLAHAMWLLVRHPDELARLRADRSLMKGFVEEALRIESPVQGQARIATRDAEIRGVPIPAGSIIDVRFGAANHDAAEFPEPDRFDITRANAGNHIAFGNGTHYCIGAPLARTEMQIAFTILLDRLADLELARPLPSPEHHPTLFYLSMRELPITFTKLD